MTVLILSSMLGFADGPPDSKTLPREFRGVWIATVDNIDWPSKKGLPVAEQKAELIKLLDRCAALHLNAVVFQVRPMCDALYASPLEPWSEFLTGTAGKAPEPNYDPLEFAVAEAHRRGMELHAWFNPYRAWHPSGKSPIPDNHIVKKRPDLAKKYGRYYWLDPGEPEVQAHSLAVMLDVVKRYDVDGVHLDDYFYPYKEAGPDKKPLPFPDDASYEKYVKSGGKLARDDWRRANVDTFVRELYRQTKEAKSWVKVGLSPFGIWRPGNPPGIQGFDQYAELYADAKLWLNEGWVDYFTPQLYWPTKQEPQSFPKLLGWWAKENTKSRHLWPGLATYRAASSAKNWTPDEIANQIRTTRTMPGSPGGVHFSMKSLLRDNEVTKALAEVYDLPVLTPECAWLKDDSTANLEMTWKDGTFKLISMEGSNIRFVAVADRSANGRWRVQRFDPKSFPQKIDLSGAAWWTIVDRTGRLIDWVRLDN